MAGKENSETGQAVTHTPPTLNAADVAALASAAALPLSPQRIAVVQPILEAWLADSAALNTLMQAEAHREVLPITVLRHGAHDGEAP